MAGLGGLVQSMFRGLSGRERAEWQSLLFLQNPVPMWVCDVETLEFLDVNEAALRQYGYGRDEFLTMRADEIRPPEDAAAVRVAIAAPLRGIHDRSLWRHRRKGGEIFPVHVVTQAIQYHGRRSLLVVAQDVSERERAAGEARRQEAERVLLAQALEQAAEAIVVTDPAGAVVYVNPAFEQLSGYARDELVGRWTPRLAYLEDEDDWPKAARAVLTEGRVWRGKCWTRRKDGGACEVDTTISPVLGHEGVVAHYVVLQRDLTEERSLQEQLFQAQKMEAVGRLAAGVAHDFNNILGIIIGYGERVERALKARDERLHANMEQVMKAAERAVVLTRQLLSFSRRPSRPEIVDVNVIVDEMAKMLRRLIGEDVQLVTRLHDGSAAILADPGQLEQILLNLAVNARDAMPDGGRLTIETERLHVRAGSSSAGPGIPCGRYVVLSVRDNGQGMDTATRARMFEPFFTTKPAGKGTGLGLATVYSIVKSSHGHVRVQSDPGMGTSFNVYWPEADGTQARGPGLADAPAPCGSEAILVVEDEESYREVLRTVLEEHGYDVVAVRSGPAALEAIEGRRRVPDLILSDVILPGMSGCDLVRVVRSEAPNVPAIYMSGHSDDALAAYGVDGRSPRTSLLHKPFSADELLRAVRRALDQPKDVEG